MCEFFVALAYLRHGDKSPIEVGYASSYRGAADLIRRWASVRSRTENVGYFRVEERCCV